MRWLTTLCSKDILTSCVDEEKKLATTKKLLAIEWIFFFKIIGINYITKWREKQLGG